MQGQAAVAPAALGWTLIHDREPPPRLGLYLEIAASDWLADLRFTRSDARDACWSVLTVTWQHAKDQAPFADRLGTVNEATVLLTDDAVVAALNARYRAQAKPTNVLSFASLDDDDDHSVLLPDQPRPLGDVVIARETCAREAAAYGVPVWPHLAHLLTHGLLHLLGYDHQDDADAQAMERVETAILAQIGLHPPAYRFDTDDNDVGDGGAELLSPATVDLRADRGHTEA